MHPWARDGVIYFNIAMACVDLAGLWYLYRSRKVISWWKAGLFAAVASLFLVSLFAFGPSLFSRFRLAGYRSFSVACLVAYVLFVHAPICLLGGAVLLRKVGRKTALLSLFGAVAVLAVGIDAFWLEPTWLDITHVRIESSKVKSPIRIAVLADLQTDEAGPYERRVLERMMAEKPDLILLAGDYIDLRNRQHSDLTEKLNSMMKEVGLKAPHGVFAVQGNVDFWYPWRKLFEEMPVVPVGWTHSFDIGPVELTCLSARDSFRTKLKVERDDPDKFHVVVGHSPDYARGEIDADLLLAGHTHGGQVQLPFVGGLVTGCSVPLDWVSGMTKLPSGANLYVSRGVGMERGSAPRIRFMCRPELVIFDLVPK